VNHTDQLSTHLTAEQFGEFIERGALEGESMEATSHLAACDQCQAELESMREALAFFRQSTSAFAERELGRSHRVQTVRFAPIHRGFSPGLAWAAAGLLVMAASLPLGLRHKPAPLPVAHHAAAPVPAELSDDALLEDINREVSASVPASMQALDDPTGDASRTTAYAQTSSTRKN
jgi:hypothetical protein